MKICNQCSTANADNAQFCRRCGAPLGASINVSQQPSISNTHIGLGDAVRICLKEKYACFSGRATRSEYWYFFLFQFLALIACGVVGVILGAIFSGGDEDVIIGFAAIIYILGGLALLCPSISVMVRRLHDTGRSGWWYWLCLIPYIGGIVVFVFLCLASQQNDNEYGPYIG